MGVVPPPVPQPIQQVAIASAPPRAKRDRIDITLTIIQAVGGVALTASAAVVGYLTTSKVGIFTAEQGVEAKRQDALGSAKGKLLDTALLVLKSPPKPDGQDRLIRAWAFDVVNGYLSDLKLDPGTRDEFIKTQLPGNIISPGGTTAPINLPSAASSPK